MLSLELVPPSQSLSQLSYLCKTNTLWEVPLLTTGTQLSVLYNSFTCSMFLTSFSQLSVLYLHLFHFSTANHHSFLFLTYTCSMFSTASHPSVLLFTYTCSMFSTANHHSFVFFYIYLLFHVLNSKLEHAKVQICYRYRY